MEIIAAKILVGFVVGVLIGLSGIGGGVLLLPVLIYGLGVPAIIAVGSDALFNFFTKIPAGLMHFRKGRVGPKTVLALPVGSVPAPFPGVPLSTRIRAGYGEGGNKCSKLPLAVLCTA